MKQNSRICAHIHLCDFIHNLDEIKGALQPNTKVCAVIKTDGYGHGALPLARIMEAREEVWGYAVATAQEARMLYDAGLKKPVLILGYVFAEDVADIVLHHVRPTVFSYESAKEFSDLAVASQETVSVHIKIDTGMNRIGFLCNEASIDEILAISKLPNLKIEGVFSHLATADEADKAFSKQQAKQFLWVVEELKKRGLNIPIKHLANSAGILDLPEYHFDMVRAGIILYGLYPSDEVGKEAIRLRPILSLKSHIVHVKEIEAGESISYGKTYVAPAKRKIATIPVGYGDGYPRALSNIGWVLIRGARAPICGRICMDQFMVDVTDIPDVAVGDVVTLIGKDGGEAITMDEIGSLSQRFHYEFACDLGKRIPRSYE